MIDGRACPSIRWTWYTFAPFVIAKDAAECLSMFGVKPFDAGA